MADPSPPAGTPVPPALPRWHGDGTTARSVRFTLALMLPVLAGALFGVGFWVVYALLTGILGFTLDTGGPSLKRLLPIAAAGLVILLGGWLGTLATGSTAWITIVLAATGLAYGIVESCDASVASAGRFLCLTASIGALFAPIAPIDVATVAGFVLIVWLISIGWDAATGYWRPSTAPKLKDELAFLTATRAERWLFAVIVAAAVAAAFLTGKALGIERPNWSVLAIVLVMRTDGRMSRTMIGQLLAGTIAGVAVAVAYMALFSSPVALLIGMTLAGILRWPAQNLYGALGLGTMAAFVVFLLELIAHLSHQATNAPLDRLIDISLGCAFALVGYAINEALQAWLRRRQAAA